MSARHRAEPDGPPWRTILAVVAGPAGLGFIIYVGILHPYAIFFLVAAGDGVIVIRTAHRLVLNMADQRPRSAEQMADRLSLIAELIGVVVVALAAVGQLRGWMHGMFRDVVIGVLGLYLIGMPVYWHGGKRRLIAVLGAWGADDGTGQ